MNWKLTSLILLSCSMFCHFVYAAPRLAFSDLVNGPVQGLGDGLGQGAIVTIWGYKLGDTPGKVIFEDSTGQQKPAAHVYYWKKADGKLPGGPANLYKSHQLYEVAFSVPTTTLGAGKIILQHNDGTASNSLPFTAIEGRIYHIKADGSNLNDGSFMSPWKFLNGDDNKVRSAGNGKLLAGDLVYFHGTTERLGDYEGRTKRAAIFLRSLNGRLDAQIALLSYPNSQAQVISETWGIHPYQSTGIIVSKFTVKGGLIPEAEDDTANVPASPSTAQISTSANGRIIGNALTDMEGRCSNGQAGAITSAGASLDNVIILGNEIFDIGCKKTSHFQHTTYLSRRTQSGLKPIAAGEFSWNYLHDNMAKYGIHYYDQTNSNSKPCDQLIGKLKISNNMIRNQRSVAISVKTSSGFAAAPCWQIDTEISNNIIVNVGLGPVAEIRNGTQPYAMILGGSIEGSFSVLNNLIINVSDEGSRLYGSPAVINYTPRARSSNLNITNNIILPNYDMPLISGDDAEIRNNILSGGITEGLFKRIFGQALTKSQQLNYFTDIKIIENGTFQLDSDSAAIGKGLLLPQVTHDFYGAPIDKKSPTIGPIQYVSANTP